MGGESGEKDRLSSRGGLFVFEANLMEEGILVHSRGVMGPFFLKRGKVSLFFVLKLFVFMFTYASYPAEIFSQPSLFCVKSVAFCI